MNSKAAWEFFNSALISGIVNALVVTILGGLFVALVSDHWQARRKRLEFQFEAFRGFLRITAGIGNTFSFLYDAVMAANGQSQPQIEHAKNEARRVADDLNGLDLQVVAVFEDATLPDDWHALNEITWQLEEAANEKVSFKDFSAVQDRFTLRARLMQFKMMREMGMLTDKRYREAIHRMTLGPGK